MSKKKLTKKDFKKDFKMVSQKFIEDFPNTPVAKMTRDFYRKNSEYGGAFQTLFGKFDNLKKEMLTEEDMEKGRDFDLEKKIVTLEAENSKLKKNNKELLKGAVEEDGLLEIYRENLESEGKSLNINNRVIKGISKKHAILNLSDWHVGETVLPEEVNGVNEYNKDIFVKRADTIFNNFVGYCDTIGIKDCTLNFLGDILAGAIHLELEVNADLSIVEGLFFVEKYLSQKLEWLSNYFNSININFLSGNHGRVTSPNSSKPGFKKKAINNWEYVLAHHLKDLLEASNNKKIKINIPKSPFMLDNVNGNVFLLHHGDTVQGGSSFGGLPYYGLASASAKLYGALNIAENVHFHNAIIGHFHTSASVPLFNGGKLFINSSLVGATEFSLMKIKMVSTIYQLMLIIDEDGKIDGEINIGI